MASQNRAAAAVVAVGRANTITNTFRAQYYDWADLVALKTR